MPAHRLITPLSGRNQIRVKLHKVAKYILLAIEVFVLNPYLASLPTRGSSFHKALSQDLALRRARLS